MGTLIIGSEALNAVLGRKVREPKDIDVISDRSSVPDDLPVDNFWDDRLSGLVPPDNYARIATLDELYTIKVSHSYWELPNNSWEKHMEDSVLLQQAGARLLTELHAILYKVWEDRHGKKQVNLEQDKGSFFKDAVVRKYDHDSIHDSVAYGERPMYEQILKEGSTVAVDMSKLKMLSFNDKIRLFREEVYATALERIVIPSDYKASPRAAYAWALRRTITSLTKGWSAMFLVENYCIMRKPDVDYVARHKSRADKLIEL